MSDFLVDLGANKTARQIITSLGLPLPMPERLERYRSAWPARPLDGRNVLVGQAGYGGLTEPLAMALGEAGATSYVVGACGPGTPWADAAEAWGRPAHTVEEGSTPDGVGFYAMVLDATGVRTAADLAGLYRFFQPRIRKLGRSGRVLVLGRPPEEATTLAEAAARRALEGFVRSVAREVGGKGATANLLTVHAGGEGQLAGPLRWFLSPASAFVSGQPLRVGTAPKTLFSATAPLAGRIVVVTGAARGIGEATVEVLAREGARVIGVDRPDDAGPLADVMRRIGGTPVAADVTAPDAAARILAAVPEGESIHAIVHNAGITRDKTLANMDASRWDLTIAVNLQAILDLTDALSPRLADGGRIIALASIAGIAGNFGQTNYAASKAAVIGFVQAASAHFAGRGITVNAIAPGFIETRLTAAIPAATREAGRRMSCVVQGGLPVDIAEAVTFFASPGSAGITGQVLRVCGGSFLGA